MAYQNGKRWRGQRGADRMTKALKSKLKNRIDQLIENQLRGADLPGRAD
jgi:hypothetical protein